MAKEVVVTASKIHKWKRLGKIVKLTILLLLLLLIIIYIVLKVVFNEGSFVVTLESNELLKSGIAMYETQYDRVGKRVLEAENIQFMTNITKAWLPENINDESDGSHNGKNYIAYTFYIENQGVKSMNYWYSIIVDDVVKNVDEAARIMIYLNGEPKVYAKGNSIDGEPEPNTIKFRDDTDGTIILEQRENLEPKQIDKFTVVVWIEGNDPECIDALIGGQLRMHMSITEDQIIES